MKNSIKRCCFLFFRFFRFECFDKRFVHTVEHFLALFTAFAHMGIELEYANAVTARNTRLATCHNMNDSHHA